MEITKFAELKNAFLQANPTGNIEKVSSGVNVKYSPAGNEYRYRGTITKIAEKMNLNIYPTKLQDRSESTGVESTVMVTINDTKVSARLSGNKILFETIISGFRNWYELNIYKTKRGLYFNYQGQRIYI